ncbi:zinc finger protein 83-like [Hetaerina americana]|uniref:zinc finger protein 83-like n=1 Tax=Hetaerina americana TaxID=62018 RepID=UPI003A7F1E2D
MLKKTIEDLLNVKVLEDKRYSWFVCSSCMEKLTEFRLFKHRCVECLFVFHNRIQKGSNPATKYLIINRKEEEGDALSHDTKGAENPVQGLVRGTAAQVWALSNAMVSLAEAEDTDTADTRVNWMTESNYNRMEFQCPGGIKKEYCDDVITSDGVGMRAVDVGDDMIFIKEETGSASGCLSVLDIDASSSMVASVEEGESHRSDNEDSGNLDRSGEDESIPVLNVDVVIKEECDVDIPQEDGGLGKEVLETQDGGQGEDGAEKDGVGNFLHWCKICNEGFAQEDILKAHVVCMHPVERSQHRVGIRSEAYKGKCDIGRHVTSVVSRQKKQECQHCGMGFTCRKDLRVHMFTHGDDGGNKCGICSKEFSQKRNLKRHLLTHTGERPYNCGLCSKSFASKADVNRHHLVHTGERPYRCALCSKTYQYKQHLDGHMLTHTGERPHKCDVCARAFTLKQQLKDHLRIHTGIKAHKCETCSKAFTFKQQLKDHLRIHAGEKLHKCQTCSKVFLLKQQLKNHIRVHSGEKPHVCVICSRSFLRKEGLKEHMLNHKCEICPNGCNDNKCPGLHNLINGIHKPFVCDVCLKTFRYKSFLRRHVNIHTRTTQHKCNICSMVFNDKKELTRHMKEYLGDKQLRCAHCTFMSISKRLLSRHLIEVH